MIIEARRTKASVLAASALAALLAVGCHRSKKYEATVEITRLDVVRTDEHGVPLTIDVEVSFVGCPGTQIEVLRGGKELSECLRGKAKVGDKVKVALEHRWGAEGHWTYEIFEVEGCPRPPDPNDEASYKVVRECSDWDVHGTSVGFQCNYADKKDLNKACPWFQKH